MKSNVMFRDYDSFGYITDNRNFAYKQVDNDDIGDKIVSQSGAVFLSVLKMEPQSLEKLAKEICNQYENVDYEMIKKDAYEFYSALEIEGFIVSGDTIKQCYEKDKRFSYKKVELYNKNENCRFEKNTNKSTEEFFEEYYENKPRLTNIHVEITSQCNERCVHCYIPHENKTTCMTEELFYSILEQCREMKVLHVTISGGEPMLHKKFVNFLCKCYTYNFSVNVLSNLTMLNQTIIDEMKKNALLSVQVSLYAMDAFIHDSITQVKGSFEKTINGILCLLENDIPVQISCPIMKQNINAYKDVIVWGQKHNIMVSSDYVIIAEYNHTIDNLKSRISKEEVSDIVKKKIISSPEYLQSIKKQADRKKVREPDDFVCSVCHSSICINEKGMVYPCAGWQSFSVGDLRKDTLNEIWNNSPKVKYLRDLRMKDFPECMKCVDREFCTMCMVRNSNEDPLGNPLKVNKYFCSIAEVVKNCVIQSQ